MKDPVGLESIVYSYLCPMLPGTEVHTESNPENAIQPRAGSRIGVSPDNNTLTLWRSSGANGEHVLLTRQHSFSSEEIGVIEEFLRIIASTDLPRVEADRVIPTRFRKDIYANSFRRAIAAFLAKREQDAAVDIIDILSSWSLQTYEGRSISAAVGLLLGDTKPKNSIPLTRADKCDWLKSILDGGNTILACRFGESDQLLIRGESAQVVNFAALKPASHLHINSQTTSPVAFQDVATWATHDRIAFLLNLHGEIMIFKNCMLKFARRRGVWTFFPHEAFTKSLEINKPDLAKAIYETCLDVSFSRSGGCIAVITDKAEEDRIERVLSDEAELDREVKDHILLKNPRMEFTSLPREVRQSLAAIDGAILLNESGKIIEIGHIYKQTQPSSAVPVDSANNDTLTNSAGGARTAAAKALSKHGVAIKISSDGMIKAYRNGKQVFAIG